MRALCEPVAMEPGFDQPVLGSQTTFRVLLSAMARPGTVHDAPCALATPLGLHPATAAICLTLFDYDSPVWTDLPDQDPSLAWLRFHCGVPVVEHPMDSRFALITAAHKMPAMDAFHTGSDDHPELAATLVVQVDGIGTGRRVTLSGPGIAPRAEPSGSGGSIDLLIEGLPEAFWFQRSKKMPAFPCGVDIVFTSGHRLAALPRTTGVIA